MAVYARRLNYLLRQIVHAVEAVSFVQLKGMREIRLQVIEIGRVPCKNCETKEIKIMNLRFQFLRSEHVCKFL